MLKRIKCLVCRLVCALGIKKSCKAPALSVVPNKKSGKKAPKRKK